jgi:hypothetical protein
MPGAIAGNNNPCKGLQTYSIPAPVFEADYYQWEVSGGGRVVNATGTMAAIDWTVTGKWTVVVTPVNSCGEGPSVTYLVEVDDVPGQPGLIAGTTSGICARSSNSTQQYSVPDVYGVNYAWRLSGGGSVTYSGSRATVSWTTGGTHTLYVTPSNRCGNRAERSIQVVVKDTPAQPSVITGNNNPCTQKTESYAVTAVAGVTYNWSLSGGGSISSSGSTATVNWTAAGTYTITATPANDCGQGPARTYQVTVQNNFTPSVPGYITPGYSGNPCKGNTKNYTVSLVSGASTYEWTLSGGGNLGAGNGQSKDITWTAKGTHTIYVKAVNACGTKGSAQSLTVTVDDAPAIGAITGEAAPCEGTKHTYSITPVAGISYYYWSYKNSSGVQTDLGGGNFTSMSITWPRAAGNYTVAVAASNGCGSNNATLPVVLKVCPTGRYTLAENANFAADSRGSEYTDEADIKVYPNPARSMLTIEIPEGLDCENIDMFNLLGEKVINLFRTKEQRINLRVDHLQRGVYFLQYTIQGRQFNKKILLQ